MLNVSIKLNLNVHTKKYLFSNGTENEPNRKKTIDVPCVCVSPVASQQEGQRLDKRSLCVAFTSAAST